MHSDSNLEVHKPGNAQDKQDQKKNERKMEVNYMQPVTAPLSSTEYWVQQWVVSIQRLAI